MAGRQDIGRCNQHRAFRGKPARHAVRQHGHRAGRCGGQFGPTGTGHGLHAQRAGQPRSGQADATARRDLRRDVGSGSLGRVAVRPECRQAPGVRPVQLTGALGGLAPRSRFQIQPVRRQGATRCAAQSKPGRARLLDLGQVVGRALRRLRVQQDLGACGELERARQRPGQFRQAVFQAGHTVGRALIGAHHQLGGGPDRVAGNHAGAALRRRVQAVDLGDGAGISLALQPDAQRRLAVGRDHVQHGALVRHVARLVGLLRRGETQPRQFRA